MSQNIDQDHKGNHKSNLCEQPQTCQSHLMPIEEAKQYYLSSGQPKRKETNFNMSTN